MIKVIKVSGYARDPGKPLSGVRPGVRLPPEPAGRVQKPAGGRCPPGRPFSPPGTARASTGYCDAGRGKVQPGFFTSTVGRLHIQ